MSNPKKLVEVEHSLLKMELEVEHDPSYDQHKNEVVSDYVQVSEGDATTDEKSSATSSGVVGAEESPAAFHMQHTDIIEKRSQGSFDSQAEQNERDDHVGKGGCDVDDNSKDNHNHGNENEHSGGGDDELHQMKLARSGCDDSAAKEKKEEETKREEKRGKPRERRSSSIGNNKTRPAVSTVWGQTLNKQELEKRKIREKKYGDGKTYKSEHRRHVVSQTLSKNAMRGRNDAPVTRFISAKERIKIHDELSPLKPKKNNDRNFNAAKPKKPDVLSPKSGRDSPSKRLKEIDKILLKKLVKKRVPAAGNVTSS